MKYLISPRRLFLRQLVNTCLHFRRRYHWQSRETQVRLIFKSTGVLIPMATFDRTIRWCKDYFGLLKQHRTGKVTGGGYRWTSAITGISFELVMQMWHLGELTYGQFKELKKLLGLVKKRGPAKLRATQALPEQLRETPGEGVLDVPT